MPKGSIKPPLGGRKKTNDGSDTHKISTKGNKKLPPLTPIVADTTNVQSAKKDTSTIDEKLEENAVVVDNISNTNATEAEICEPNNITANKTKVINRRKTGSKLPTPYTNTTSSGIPKRVSAKPKIIDVEQTDSQVRIKSRKKVVAKSKPSEKQLDIESNVTDTSSKEVNWPKQAMNPLPKPQWTNIVKRVQIHKHLSQKYKAKTMKKKDLLKRKKSEYVIENTWLPREPTTDSTTSQKPTKKLKTNSKASKENRKLKEGKSSSSLLTQSKDGLETPVTDSTQLEQELSDAARLAYTESQLTHSSNLESQGENANKDNSANSSTCGRRQLQSATSDNNQALSVEVKARNGDTNQDTQDGLEDKDLNKDADRAVTTNHPIKVHQVISSPKLNSSPKPSYSPKLHPRETTHVNQINVADFAKLHLQTVKPVEAPPTIQNITDYQYRVSKVRFKGASNSVPNYNDKQENTKKVVAQNDALLANTSQNKRRQDQPPIYVSKIEPKSPSKSTFLLPTTAPHRNKFMDMLIGDAKTDQTSSPRSTPDDSFPRISYGSPIPLQKPYSSSDDEMSGEVSIIVPKLPHLNNNRRVANQSREEEGKRDRSSAEDTDTTQHTEDEPIVIVTNVDGVDVGKAPTQERDGWESGYSSMTPRLSIDSRAHALTPMSSAMAGSTLLEIPNDHRSMTPFSTTTTSTYLDHSRPQSTFLDVPHFIGESHDFHSKKYPLESRTSINKLPAIYSRNDDVESMAEDHRLDFTPLPLLSIRTSDGELSD